MRLVGAKPAVERAVQELGYADRPTTATDMVFVGTGIVLGGLVGLLSITVAGIPLTLTASGGALIMGLVFGWLRSVYPFFGRIPEPAIWIFDTVGLCLFIGVVGLSAGPSFISGLKTTGISLVLIGLVSALLPHTLGILFGRYVLRMNPLIVLGACAGAGTVTAALRRPGRSPQQRARNWLYRALRCREYFAHGLGTGDRRAHVNRKVRRCYGEAPQCEAAIAAVCVARRAWLTKALSLLLLIYGATPAIAQAQSQPTVQYDTSQDDVTDSVNQGATPMNQFSLENPQPSENVVPESLQPAPEKKFPFLDDSKFSLQLRTYFFYRDNFDNSLNEAWTIGGSFSYKSGYLANILAIGAVAYTSQPLYAPNDRDGTLLLRPGQDAIHGARPSLRGGEIHRSNLRRDWPEGIQHALRQQERHPNDA